MQAYWPTEYEDMNFILPEELIATHPIKPADHARLMVIDRRNGGIMHKRFDDLAQILRSGDSIFYNATQVEARRAYLKKPDAEKLYECVFLKASAAPPPSVTAGSARQSAPPLLEGRPPGAGEVWQVLMRSVRRLRDGDELVAAKDPTYKFMLHRSGSELTVASAHALRAADFARIGEMPIPPYMRRIADANESDTYQNFFSQQIAEKEKVQGSAASPTAALHFTTGLHEKLRQVGVDFYPLCLDIGYGTFAPLSEENFASAELHAEHFYIPPVTADKFTDTANGRKIALGTTSLRGLLSYQRYGTAEGETSLFVTPHETITGIEGLITNFHLPQSSLLLLTAAFCGRELLACAYREAIEHKYRFYSYGDAMLII